MAIGPVRFDAPVLVRIDPWAALLPVGAAVALIVLRQRNRHAVRGLGCRDRRPGRWADGDRTGSIVSSARKAHLLVDLRR